MSAATWNRVSRDSPCPICGKPDNCEVSQDGQMVWCGRVADGALRENSGGQYLHRLSDAAPFRPMPDSGDHSRLKGTATLDLDRLARQWAENAGNHRERLASQLGVSVESLTAMSVGFDQRVWTFPERDATGRVIGISRRSADGRKQRLRDTRAGLSYVPDWNTNEGPVLLVEGPTDTAALWDLGFTVVGRPSNCAGVSLLADLLKDVPSQREIVVLGERDQKPDGRWPGREGAIRTAEGLAERLHRTVHWALPPDDAKDARAWKMAQGERPQHVLAGLFLSGINVTKESVSLEAIRSIHVPSPGDEHPLGSRDPLSGRLILSAKQTLPTAEAYVREFHQHADGRTIRCFANELLEWKCNRYQPIEDSAVRQRLQEWLHRALRYAPRRGSDGPRLVDFESNPHTVSAALESIRTAVYLDAGTPSPSWLDPRESDPSPQAVIACRSGLLIWSTMTWIEATPRYFTTSSLDFDPDPDAPLPEHWYRFLLQLFDADRESIELLQEWFGYCLTGDTTQQKMLLMVGPKRSGKGTIARVLAALVGTGNVCGPTTSSLAGPFGLQPLVGKSLGIISDARFHGEGISTVVERLLCISGEDRLTVDRKHMSSLTIKLPTRLMFLTNELPRLSDSSGALANRFLIIKLTQSFHQREDPHLTETLLGELPGILNWAMDGLRRLQERRHFVMPSSATQSVQEMEDLASPVASFVRDCCEIGNEQRVSVNDLYEAWKRWCDREGRKVITSKQVFGRDLAAAFPNLACRRDTAQQRFYQGISLTGGQL